jgi:hypothetical protein
MPGRPVTLGLCTLALLAGSDAAAQDAADAATPETPRSIQPGPVMLPPPRLEPGQVLDLRLGDIRRHVPARQWSAPLPERLEDVEVIGRQGTPDMVETRPVPMGLGALFFAARHPTQIWRIFVPDPNFQLPEEDRSNK